MQHDRSAGQFAQIDSITNFEATSGVFSGNGPIMNAQPPRFGGMASSFHVYDQDGNMMNGGPNYQGLVVTNSQQSVSSLQQRPPLKQNMFQADPHDPHPRMPQNEYDTRSQQVFKNDANYMD